MKKSRFTLFLIVSIFMLSCGKNGDGNNNDSDPATDPAPELCYEASATSCEQSYCIYLVSLDDCEYGGNLGGIVGADGICNNVLPTPLTSAKALLVVSGERQAPSTDWPLAASTEYFTPTGDSIGTTNATATFTFPLTQSIGTEASGEVWTGLTNSWGVSGNCSEWTSVSGTGIVGSVIETDSDAINIYLQNCNRNDVDIICVGQ